MSSRVKHCSHEGRAKKGRCSPEAWRKSETTKMVCGEDMNKGQVLRRSNTTVASNGNTNSDVSRSIEFSFPREHRPMNV